MAAKKLKPARDEDSEMDSFQCYGMDDMERITTYDRKSLERFRREGVLKTRKLNGGKVVSTKKWIIEFLESISDDGPLEF